ncbi:PQQ-dependent sugar dehydrogenase [Mucilaginibacter celer]|uniref:Sorbosone dehydrogenase n=1 Tax=Mucilaginibacter celer TaxID=2305508 RepID=A0A494VZ41_9SPHI|nr:PQQ-dependent sugar dehydrogenase [Mucilaginibacter celer]AYL96588.1 sorbosone dehydrogenase [Mucilaginibacter celer]
MNKKALLLITVSVAIVSALASFKFTGQDGPIKNKSAADAGIKIPEGFSATIIADNLGPARHMVVTPNNDIYVHLEGFKNGKGIVVLHDNGDKADVKTSFGNFGGTGIRINNGYLYASSDKAVYRFKLNDKQEVTDPEHPETVVSGLISRRAHKPKAIAFDNEGNLYVNIGAYSNICSEFDPRKKGCPILDSAGAIWKFKTDKINQKQSDGIRFASGLRNVVGLDWNQQDNQLFVMQHGRDALHDLFPKYYTTQQSALLPAECMYALKQGDDAGWPYMYYDDVKHKKILGPEYGGDGEKEADAKYLDPVAAYPGHLAPDGLLFYTGSQFPEKYKNGAFIAFHGSWNRAPEPQAGYFVVFQPFKNGKPDGKWEVFADGFAGTAEETSPGKAEHRPCGLAQGADGSLYVSDDLKGTIYKITYKK